MRKEEVQICGDWRLEHIDRYVANFRTSISCKIDDRLVHAFVNAAFKMARLSFAFAAAQYSFYDTQDMNLPVLIEQNILVLSFRRFFIVFAFSLVNARY